MTQGFQSQVFALESTTTGGTWGTIMTNSRDQASLLNQVVGTAESPLPETQREVLRDLMSRVESRASMGSGQAVDGIPENWTAAVKNGWYLSVEGDRPPVGLWRINTLGYVWDPSQGTTLDFHWLFKYLGNRRTRNFWLGMQ
jgi:hypothetical protein